ncbi:hypothetical protein MBM_03147 [Drepanopeziza brunnea f. sp. 'multigermtubi' MB_m1]|uniref:Uncharacterized protein n=1 Tax=Marssonina brunnea f. sp. multigermtubi (strain MB_m1) TaxID=1072389 RepID=K1WMG7_MARBU|nr:uncharacterized protein MBM_03147 [Drepanopeziza brunnea f. sp. 'multigermtubi' MB_m1]EKD18905.1 hypothetical protein MBM_03147 [Drepanopeziza brunnea f. sp. 'multigermtubi' MB_m1]
MDECIDVSERWVDPLREKSREAVVGLREDRLSKQQRGYPRICASTPAPSTGTEAGEVREARSVAEDGHWANTDQRPETRDHTQDSTPQGPSPADADADADAKRSKRSENRYSTPTPTYLPHHNRRLLTPNNPATNDAQPPKRCIPQPQPQIIIAQ